MDTKPHVPRDPSMANPQLSGLLAQKLNSFLPLSPDELRGLAELQSAPPKVKRGKEFVHEGQTGHKAFVLQAGWACSYKMLRDGAARSSRFRFPATASGCAASCCEPQTIPSSL